MAGDVILIVLIVLPFVGSLVAGLLPAGARTEAAILAGSIALIGFVIAIALYPQIADGQVLRHDIAWLPTLGLNVVLRLNGLSWLFTVMVTGIGFLVVLYARYYMSPKDPVPRFFSFFLAFMGAMLGIVLSGNLIQLVMFWELTGIFSFFLIGYWHHNS
ncbi:MAG TPA: monovalent cation/H+ antiporter subunit A, partial [Devosia sp.]|nr:monovalent cation/H+ antiporter subunit A [Devosia sp.]